jgi:hypothetical protein
MLKVDSNVKVQRWMLALQAYDYDIEHIKGVNNTVADGLRRFFPDERTLLGKTKSPNSLKEAGSSKKGDEDNLGINKERRSTGTLEPGCDGQVVTPSVTYLTENQ